MLNDSIFSLNVIILKTTKMQLIEALNSLIPVIIKNLVKLIVIANIC